MKRDEAVILLHGLCRSHLSMRKLANNLKAQSYHAINVSYPSRQGRIETLATRYLTDAITACQSQGAQRIHFVTHSMGAILVRYYLRHTRLDELGYVVMLSPPNQGSELVDKLGKLRLFRHLHGPAGLQLGTTEHSLPNQLGAVNYPVGVITGNRSINPVLSLLIPGQDDGKVSVARTRLAGMSDFRVVPHTHPMIMQNREVIQQVTHFLRQGQFAPQSECTDYY